MKIFILLLLTLSLWANIGNIMAIKGSADVKRGEKTLNATNGMVLEKGDTLLTAKKSRIQVMLQDETVVTIGSNSSFSFEEYFYDSSKNSKLTMRANRGFFRSVTGEIGKLAPERFKVKTVSATIGIRGTDFSGNILGESEVFKCYEGAIFVEFEGAQQELDAGMMAEIFKGKFDVKKFDMSKAPKELSKLKGMVIKAIDEGVVPTEAIADITQIVEDETNVAENPDDDIEEDLNVITTSAEDRPQQY